MRQSDLSLVPGLLGLKQQLWEEHVPGLCIQTPSESEGEKLRRLALGKVVENLRNAGGLYNTVYVNSPGEISQLQEFCQLYFNLLALFFPNSKNVSVWTLFMLCLIQ